MPMHKTSTPESQSTTSGNHAATPKKRTLAFLKQFARCYSSAPINPSIAGIIAN